MNIEMTRANVTYVLFRRRSVIAVIAILAVALAIAYCMLATPQYQSRSGLVVRFSPMQAGVPGEVTQGAGQAVTPVDHEEIINSYTLELRSAALARQVIEEIGVEKLYPSHRGLVGYLVETVQGWFAGEDGDEAVTHEKAVEAAVDRFLRKDLDVQSERNTNVITVTLLNSERAMAVAAAGRLIDRFIEREGKLDRDPRLDFIRDQVEVYRRHVSDAQAAMEAFQVRNGISSLEEERTALIQQRSNLEQSIVAVHSRFVGDEKSYETLKSQMHGLQPGVATAQNDRDPLELTARTNLADLQAREAALRQSFGEDSQAIQDLRKRIAAAEQVLERVRSRSPLTHAEPSVAYQQVLVALFQAKADLEASRESEASQREELNRLNRRLAVRNQQQAQYQDAVRDYQLADQNYRLYLQGVESARIADDLNKQRITSISVFDAPYAPARPTRPQRLVALIMGLLGGLGLGMASAFLCEALDEGLTTPSQVASVLRMPVLGSMERICE